MLVTLAVVAVVAGIIFPVFANAKFAAKVEVGKQYLKQQFIAIELYANDCDGTYPSYSDVLASKSLKTPCSPLYDWNAPCWAPRSETVTNPITDAPAPTIGGRGYIYAVRNWQKLDELGKDQFLGWDRTKPYPILCDIFSAHYRVREFTGEAPNMIECNKSNGILDPNKGCQYPEVIWYAYSDGSIKAWRQKLDTNEGAHQLFDWLHAFLRRMDKDTKLGE